MFPLFVQGSKSSCFLPNSKDIHIRLTGYSECGATMTMNGCLFYPIKDLETYPGWRWGGCSWGGRAGRPLIGRPVLQSAPVRMVKYACAKYWTPSWDVNARQKPLHEFVWMLYEELWVLKNRKSIYKNQSTLAHSLYPIPVYHDRELELQTEKVDRNISVQCQTCCRRLRGVL